MAGNAIQVSVADSDALDELAAKMPRAHEVLTNFEKLAKKLVFPQIRSHVTEVYDTQGAATGHPWAAYDEEPKYAKFKAAVLGFTDSDDNPDPSQLPVGDNQPGGVMRWKETDESEEWLYPSLTDESDPRHLRNVNGSTMVYGSSVPYAKRLAQEGGTNPFGEPYGPRHIFLMPEDKKSDFMKAIDAWYRAELKKAGVT